MPFSEPGHRALVASHRRLNKVIEQEPYLIMRLEQIDHLALRCASPEATKAWYVNTLGFEHVFPGQWGGTPIVLRLGSTYLTLFPQKENEPPSANGRAWHLALRAANYADFQSAQTELQARGISFQFRDHEIAHSIYFTDPDSFLLEITTYDVLNQPKTS
jgi:catechol 2,3-dioxygenase-like lactoylglutathione lyase family enzyme